MLIIGESHALWPFLPEYKDLGLVTKEQNLINTPNCFKTNFMLAQGTGTMPTINGFVTGLADAGIYPNSQPESYKTKYGTGIGSVMKALGYRTVFGMAGLKLGRISNSLLYPKILMSFIVQAIFSMKAEIHGDALMKYCSNM